MKSNARRRRAPRILLIVLAVIVVLTAGGLTFIGNYFYHFALDPSSEHFFGGGFEEDGQERPVTDAERWFSTGEAVHLESGDGLTLTAYQFFGQPGHHYVVACHGYGNQASGMAANASLFCQMGFNALLPDARGFGASEGDYAGMGWHERRDIVAWCNYILDQDPQALIVLYGVSMGAATVMMAAGESDLPSAVKLVIEDCGYTSVWDEFAAQLDQLFSLPTFPILDVTSLVTQVKAGWSFKEASALEQIKNCAVPVLFIHGEEDAFVPFDMVYSLYAAAGCPKRLLTIPGAAHAQSSSVDPELYWRTIADFLAEYLPD